MDVTIADATASGCEIARRLLADVPSTVTLRELVRLRVREEVARHNADVPGGSRHLDWEQEATAAVEAFQRNGFFVFVGARQIDNLDERLRLAETDVVSFVRLVPLEGG